MPKTTRVIPGRPTTNSLPKVSSDGWNDLEMDDAIRMAVYGRSGTGKTTMASSFPGPIRWLVCSGGNKPGELKSIDTPELREKVTPKKIRHTNDILAAVEEAKSGKYATIVMDHMTGLVNQIVMEVKNLKEAPVGWAQSNAQADKGMTLVTEQEWGFIGAKGIELLRAILDLPINSIIIAQQNERTPKKKKDKSGNDMFADFSGEDISLPFVGSQMTPMIEKWFYPAVDYIVGTYIRPKFTTTRQEPKIKGGNPIITTTRALSESGKPLFEFCLRTGEHDTFITKFRMPKSLRSNLPECIVNPTYQKILAVTRGEEITDD